MNKICMKFGARLQSTIQQQEWIKDSYHFFEQNHLILPIVGTITALAVSFFSAFASHFILGISIGFGIARIALKGVRYYNFTSLALIDDKLRSFASYSYRTRVIILLFSIAVWKFIPVIAFVGFLAVGILSGLAIEFYRAKQRFSRLNKNKVMVFI